MADITLHDLAPEAAAALAKKRGVALEDVAREILDHFAREALDQAAAKVSRAALLARIDPIRGMTLKPHASESGALLGRR